MSLRIPFSRKWLRPRVDSMAVIVECRLEGVDEAGRPWHCDISDVRLVAGKYIDALSNKLAAKGLRRRLEKGLSAMRDRREAYDRLEDDA